MDAATFNCGVTALMWATKNGHLEVVHELCKRGTNVNAAITTDGSTALMWASQEGHLAVVQCLLDHGANKAALSLTGESAYGVASGSVTAALHGILKPS